MTDEERREIRALSDFSNVGRGLIYGGALVLIIAGLRADSSIMVPLLLALFLSIVCAPLLNFFQRRLPFSFALGLVLTMLVALPMLSAAAQEEAAKVGGDTAATLPVDSQFTLDDPSIELDELRLRLVPLTVEELAVLAEAWQKHARAAAQEVTDISLVLRAAESAGAEAEEEAAHEKLVELVKNREVVFEKFLSVISGFEAKGGSPEEATKMRIYLEAVREEGKSQLTLEEAADWFLNWLVSPEGGGGVGIRLAIFLGSLFGLFVVARIVRTWARRAFVKIPNLSKLLRGFLVMVVYWLTIAVGLMIVLAALGVDITPLFAMVGGASFIIAFALQETLGNLASGLMIMISRPFDEGDLVKISGLLGKVVHVSVVSTTITTPDNQIIVIPNSKVWGDVITNVTASDKRRIDLVFGIGYNDSIEKTQRIIEDLVANHPLVLDDPEPIIKLHELADSSVNFIVRPWVVTENYWEVYWDLQRSVKEAFDANDVAIPYPQRDIHVHFADNGDGEGSSAPNRIRQST